MNIIKESVIPKGNDYILYEVSFVFNYHKIPDEILIKMWQQYKEVSRQASRMVKKIIKDEGKHNVSLTLSNIKDIKIEDFWLITLEVTLVNMMKKIHANTTGMAK